MLNKIIGKYKNTKHYLSSVFETIIAGYPARNLKVIGVTGTDGKTTTCHLIYHIFKYSDKKVALLSTIGAYIGDVFVDTGLHTTTPDARFLQPIINKIAKSGMEYLILEATSHGLDQHRVLGTNIQTAVLTNITHDHLDYHNTFDEYKNAKAKLFKDVKLGILNKDDTSFEYVKRFLKPDAKLVTYSIEDEADLFVNDVKLSNEGMNFMVNEDGKQIQITTQLFGKYNISNILAAICVARNCGVDWSAIQSSIKSFNGVEGRMEFISSNKNFTTIVDFAHTPNSLKSVLLALTEIKSKDSKIILVFGCAGERDKLKRPIMGEIAADYADISIFTAEDPRKENVNDIIDAIMEGAVKSKQNHEMIKEPDRKTAIELAISKANAGDIVIICGKGHEKSMNFGDKEIPWSDQKVAQSALQ